MELGSIYIIKLIYRIITVNYDFDIFDIKSQKLDFVGFSRRFLDE